MPNKNPGAENERVCGTTEVEKLDTANIKIFAPITCSLMPHV